VVVTLFRGYEDEAPHIARAAGNLDLVLQQGVEGMVPPLSAAELKKVGDRLKRPVKYGPARRGGAPLRVIGVVGLPASGKGEFSRIAREMGVPVVVMGT